MMHFPYEMTFVQTKPSEGRFTDVINICKIRCTFILQLLIRIFN